MKSTVGKLIAFCLMAALMLSLLSTNVFADSVSTEETPYESYTYWEGLGSQSKTKVFVRPMYEVKAFIDSNALKLPDFGTVDDICCADGMTYILDSKSSKIYILNADYQLNSVIDKIMLSGQPISVAGASGIFVKNQLIYLADTQNARILVMDCAGTVQNELLLPESKLIPKDFKYSPIKVAIDSKDYLYIVSDGSYYGALVYSPSMEFLGFYGANTVAVSVGDAIRNFFNDLFSTNAKKAASIRALPYQFTDFAIDADDFVYTVTSTAEENASTGQVKRLNPGGKDVLGGGEFNFADESNRLQTPESLKSIDVDEDGFFYLLESGTFNRVFWYDKESNLICVFGGGTSTQVQKGTLSLGGAVSVNGTDVLVSDPVNKNVTVFGITEYGKLVRDAQVRTLNDDFEKTIDDWKRICRLDVNNQLAYRGLAKAYYTKKDYVQALKYAKKGADRATYADAFVKVRTQWLESNFTLLVLGCVVLIAAFISLHIYKKKKGIKWIKNQRFKVMLSGIFHPFESFRLVKEKGMGSTVLATAVLTLFYIISAIRDVASGFAYNYFDVNSYNSFFVLLRTVALVLLFVISNWLVCVLMGGIGKLKEIYIVTCYSLIPTVFASVAALLLSHVLAPEEFVFVSILETICLVYTFFMLMVGIMKIHDFEFGKFLGTTVVTAISMLIITFLIFLIFMLGQQVWGWIGTVITELKYR